MRQENLTVIQGGLNRLRTKGAALKDSLFELLNGFVTTERTVKVRPGTFQDFVLPAGTKGLVAFGGKFHVFADDAIVGLDENNFVLHILKSPNPSATLSIVHFAEPFMGFLYVAAEFSDAETYHYWLQTAPDWQPNEIYNFNELASATTPTGFVFRARRAGGANPSWTAETPRAVGDRVEPSPANGFYFEVTQVIGPNPRSGLTEPAWPAAAGAIVVEDADEEGAGGTPPTPTPPTDPPPTFIPPGTEDRYSGGSVTDIVDRNIAD